MERITLNHVAYLAVAAVLALLFVQLHQGNKQLMQLAGKLESLETDQIHIIERLRTTSTSAINGELDKLQARIASLQSQLDASAMPVATPKPGGDDGNSMSQTNQQTQKPESVAQTSPEFKQLMESGYLSQETWAQVDARIKAMPQENNKLFWQTLFEAIESGELQLLAQQE